MKLQKMHWYGVIAAAVIVLAAVIFFRSDERILLFMVGLAFGSLALPFVIGLVSESQKEEKVNQMFLEFSRNLAESVAAGTPISKGIINMRKKDLGELNENVLKLGNQIEMGVPIERAFQTFADDIDNVVIKRAVSLIREAEKAGGEIDFILDSTARSISEVEKLKKERKSAIYSLIVQGYIIFFIFIGILLVMEFKILPLAAGIGSFGGFSAGDISSLQNKPADSEPTFDPANMTMPFLYLLLAQGFFIGLVIGKLTEGSIKRGLKHSFILMIAALLISSGARLFFAPTA